MDKLVPAFETTLFDPTLSDACSDMAELGIDGANAKRKYSRKTGLGCP